MTSGDVQELAHRAARHGYRLARWTDPRYRNGKLNLDAVVFALRRDGGPQVRCGSLQNVARLLDKLDERQAT